LASTTTAATRTAAGELDRKGALDGVALKFTRVSRGDRVSVEVADELEGHGAVSLDRAIRDVVGRCRVLEVGANDFAGQLFAVLLESR
jgi:hypothetical protein